MPNQDNPSTHQLRVRVTEEVFRTLERLAAKRGYPDVSSLVRAILTEAGREVRLSADDYAVITERVRERERALESKGARNA